MSVSIDTSELDELVALLDAAAARARKDRARALEEQGAWLESEARSNASAFHTASTGELASSIERTGTPLTQEVNAPVRQGFFLEYGSPTTGGPRPWLSGPLAEAGDRLLKSLGESVDLL